MTTARLSTSFGQPELNAAMLAPMSVPPDHPRTLRSQALQSLLVVPVPQVSRYSLERCAEDEGFYSRKTVLKPVYELKKYLAVKVHRPRHIAYHDQPGLLLFALLERKLD